MRQLQPGEGKGLAQGQASGSLAQNPGIPGFVHWALLWETRIAGLVSFFAR